MGFMSDHDAASPDFWQRCFLEGQTPWDAGGVPEEVESYLARPQAQGRVLIPGCGAAYEALAFHQAGHQVVAVDFSPAALAVARKTLGSLYGEMTLLADFFHPPFAPHSFDLVYERAFFCALPRRLWPAYVLRVAELLRPGGALIGFFYFNEREKGPPFGLQVGELHRLLNRRFIFEADEPSRGSAPIFAGRERWFEWRRRAENHALHLWP
jgi:SAM-dependent methyltransferase